MSSLRDTITNPIYLVELGFDPVLHLSSGRNLVWKDHHWKSAPFTISFIDNDAVGG